MPDARPHVLLRAMTLADVDQVFSLDQMSFPSAWPKRTYHYELTDNENSRLFVLEPVGAPPVIIPKPAPSWWERLLGIGNGNGNGHKTQPFICGYAGMWHIVDEAHISTIAIHPGWRGMRLGELLVWCMIRQAILQHATQITLEVRIGNKVAQTLYKKYGFEVMGLRKNYYRDNGEDAYMMAVMRLDDAYREKMNTFGEALAGQVRVTDHWWGNGNRG